MTRWLRVRLKALARILGLIGPSHQLSERRTR